MQLERRFAIERERFAGGGVGEGEVGCMEEQAGVFMAVKLVADDGGIQTVAMGAVDAQLVCAACLWGEKQTGTLAIGGKYFIAGDGRSAIHRINQLSRTVIEVGTERQADGSTTRNRSFNHGKVLFVDHALQELALQGGVSFLRAGHDHDARGLHV